MNKNGRPNLGYSNLFWQRVERSPEAKIHNREELIQEVLSEPKEIPIDRLQLMSLTKTIHGEHDDETRCIKITERDENNRHIDAKTYRDAV
jgi:hypothetical protein